MKARSLIFLFLIGLVLAGCGGGGGGSNGGSSGNAAPAPVGTVRIDCADVTNAPTTACQKAASVNLRYVNTAQAAATILQYGDIHVTEEVHVGATVTNSTATAYRGYYTIFLDVDCKNGLPRGWRITNLQHIDVPAGQSVTIDVGANCEAADPGPTTISLSLYDDLAGTILRDQVVGMLTLIP